MTTKGEVKYLEKNFTTLNQKNKQSLSSSKFTCWK